MSLEPLPLFCYEKSVSIFIRKCYVELFDTIWKLGTSMDTGVIITGQPGTGVYFVSHIYHSVS